MHGWKTRKKLLVSLEKKGMNLKQQKLRSEDLKKVGKAVYTWFISKQTLNKQQMA